MAASQTDIKSQTIELATKAFGAFCQDISSMFNVGMKCSQKGVCTETAKGLNKRFEKLAAVNFIKTKGVLDGIFPVMFDQGGLFTLAGIIVMQPKQKILDNRKLGSTKDAQGMTDAIREAGNLLVGTWDRIFREEMEGHGRFVQTNTFIGDPWDNPKEKIGLSDDEEFSFVPYEITIDDYPAFNCGVILPEAIFKAPAPNAEPSAPADEKTQEKPQEEPAAEKTPVPAMLTDGTEPASGPVSETIQRMVKSSTGLPDRTGLISLSMCAKDIMQKEVLWGNADDSVQQAITKMQQADVSYMMVGSNGQIDGIVSTFDLASALSVYLKPMFAKWRRPTDDATLQIRIKWIMTRPVRTIKPDTSLTAIMENMCQLGSRCLPVVEKGGKVVGMVTVFDVFKAVLNTESGISTAGKTPQAPALA
ncbi:MAG: CBS domain-containing protein [Sedimentisphaerales bacterium]|jgi:CBS domain-containing protein